MSEEDLSEISLVYKIDDSDEYKIEIVYAKKIGKYYQLENAPMFANNVACGDIISAEFDSGHLFFDELIMPSGHSVVHVVVFNGELFDEITEGLLSFEINVSRLPDHWYLILDIPPDVNYFPLRDFLIDQKQLANIDFKEACISANHTGI